MPGEQPFATNICVLKRLRRKPMVGSPLLKNWRREARMKSLTLSFLAGLMFVAMSLAAQGSNTFTGEIMDSACAKMGSHDPMMKSHPNMKTEKDCTLGCVKAGSQYVLYDASTKTVYEL